LAKAFTNFTRTIERSKQVIALYRDGVNLTEKEDLVRFSVILSVSALDSYFTDKFCDVLVPFLKKREPTDDLVEILEKAGLNTRTALELISMERPFRRIRTLVERSFSNYTTQRTDVIDKLFTSIGLQDFSNNAQKIVGRRNLKSRIQTLVNKRNDIAHEGDLDSRGKTKKIDVDIIEGQISDLDLFVCGAEELIKKKMSSKNR
jgi:hypothetical protein